MKLFGKKEEKQPRKPGEKVRMGEKITAVLTSSDGSKKIIAPGKK